MFTAERVRLLTNIGNTGKPAIMATIGTFPVPPFQVMPDVVTLGDRTFNKTDRSTVEGDGTIVVEYVESFTYCIPPEQESLEAMARKG